jgi:two-component system, LuxR family, response regulator FixJ
LQHSATISILDDDADVCRSLGMLLRRQGYIVEEHHDARHLLDTVDPDCACIISDVRMPDMSGLDLMQAMRAAGFDVPFIFMTGHSDVAMAVQAMKLGAVDFLVKPFDLATVLASIATALGKMPDNEDSQIRFARLSKREHQVLRGVVDGGTNKEIARTLGLSPRTVEVYRAHVMNKMNATNLSQLVRAGIMAGLV